MLTGEDLLKFIHNLSPLFLPLLPAYKRTIILLRIDFILMSGSLSKTRQLTFNLTSSFVIIQRKLIEPTNPRAAQ